MSCSKIVLGDPGTYPPITESVLPTIFGWPTSGGVWVFKPTEEQWDEYNRLPVTESMEVHCENLKRFGATFYEDVAMSEDAKIAAGGKSEL